MALHPTHAALDLHRFRVAHGVLLDFPLTPALGSRPWIATIWPDHHQPGAWARTMWTIGPGGRGWTCDPHVHLGDVIEFGADTSSAPDRWYGYATHADATSLSVVGPFPNPAEAASDGHASLQPWRHFIRLGH